MTAVPSTLCLAGMAVACGGAVMAEEAPERLLERAARHVTCVVLAGVAGPEGGLPARHLAAARSDVEALRTRLGGCPVGGFRAGGGTDWVGVWPDHGLSTDYCLGLMVANETQAITGDVLPRSYADYPAFVEEQRRTAQERYDEADCLNVGDTP